VPGPEGRRRAVAIGPDPPFFLAGSGSRSYLGMLGMLPNAETKNSVRESICRSGGNAYSDRIPDQYSTRFPYTFIGVGTESGIGLRKRIPMFVSFLDRPSAAVQDDTIEQMYRFLAGEEIASGMGGILSSGFGGCAVGKKVLDADRVVCEQSVRAGMPKACSAEARGVNENRDPVDRFTVGMRRP
jgi:hypothetical protein